MPTCPRCGKANLKDALFCQDCGQRLGAPEASATVTAAAPTTSDQPTCPRCHTVNDAGMSFCKMCGASLAAFAAGPALDAALSMDTPAVAGPSAPTPVMALPAATVPATASGEVAKLSCFSCNKQTPAGFAFCQHCGTRLATVTPPSAASTTTPRRSVPPGGRLASPGDGSRAVRGLGDGARSIAQEIERSTRVATATAAASPPSAHDPSLNALDARATARPSRIEPRPLAPRSDARAGVPWARLVLVRDGVAGEGHALAGDTFDVGRADGNLVIASDPFLAARHLRLVYGGGTVKVRSLDGTNGVYLKIRDGHDLTPGDQILVGRQLLRFESLAPEERDPPSVIELGVRLLGSALREPWGRLRQLTPAGTTRDVHHLCRPEIVLGRERGDILFPDDDLVAPRNAVLRKAGARVRLEEGGSGSATFVRLRGERELKHGDVLRFGEQVARVEIL